MPVRQGQTLRFGPFSLDPRCGELRTNGTRIKLQGQPIQILELLLEKPGELVTREEIRQKLWSSDTFVDFDHNLNTAIKKLRQALGDEADTPKYIETLPRYGYRFIGEVAQEEERPSDKAADQSPEHLPSPSPVTPSASKSTRVIWILATVVAVILAIEVLVAAFAINRWLPAKNQRVAIRSQLKLRGPKILAPNLSRDGRHLLYLAGSTPQIWIRDLQGGTDELLAGTEGASAPFWSPDGRYIGFFTFAPNKLKKIAVHSRIITEICDINAGRSSWGTSNVILVNSPVGVKAVSVETGGIEPLSEEKTDWVDTSPWFLPDGQHYLFVRISKNRYLSRGASGVLYIGALDRRPSRSLDIRVVGFAAYAAGHLVYTTHHGLFSQPFDVSGLRVLGEPTLLIPYTGTSIHFSASENATLVGFPAAYYYEGDSDLRVLTRDGKQVNELIAQGYPDQARFSPDGKRLAYDQVAGDVSDIWIYDLERRLSTRLTPGDSLYTGPVWSPDGKHIAYRYSHTHTRGIAVRNSDGSGQPEILFENTNDDPLYYWPRSWGREGECLFVTVTEINGPRKIGVLPLTGDRKVKLLPAPKNSSRISPTISLDGKWLAYFSEEAEGNRVFVEPYPGSGDKTLVYSGNGAHPQWRRDGRELFYLSDNQVQAVSIEYAGKNIRVGKPVTLFSFPPSLSGGSPFNSSPDGQLFVVNTATVPVVTSDTVDLITNWDSLVKK